jgi:ribosomal-protein-alanine N-acetyltransferase
MRYQTDGYGLWALVRKFDRKLIGQCGITNQIVKNRTVPEIGYLLNREVWHQGYAIEAAEATKKYAFETLKLKRVYSIIRNNNIASMNVAIRNQMLVNGIEVKHYYDVEMPHLVFYIDNPDLI